MAERGADSIKDPQTLALKVAVNNDSLTSILRSVVLSDAEMLARGGSPLGMVKAYAEARDRFEESLIALAGDNKAVEEALLRSRQTAARRESGGPRPFYVAPGEDSDLERKMAEAELEMQREPKGRWIGMSEIDSGAEDGV